MRRYRAKQNNKHDIIYIMNDTLIYDRNGVHRVNVEIPLKIGSDICIYKE
jgi:hypothetical protein